MYRDRYIEIDMYRERDCWQRRALCPRSAKTTFRWIYIKMFRDRYIDIDIDISRERETAGRGGSSAYARRKLRPGG